MISSYTYKIYIRTKIESGTFVNTTLKTTILNQYVFTAIVTYDYGMFSV